MSIQQLHVEITPEKKLACNWVTMTKVQAIQVVVAEDTEFTKGLLTFLLPENAPGCSLDVGNGSWYVHVGAWLGDKNGGRVEWSGIHGPYVIEGGKAKAPEKMSMYRIPMHQVTEKGLRLYTRSPDPNYMLVDTCTDRNFPTSMTKTVYVADWGQGNVEIKNLQPDLTYFVRYVPFPGYPTRKMVQLPRGHILEGIQPLSIPKPLNATNHVSTQADVRFLQEAKERRNLRFLSQADYIKYKAAKAIH